jgi:hypothetical protein
MDSREYVNNVLITESKEFAVVANRLSEVRNIRLIHASAGVSSEISELVELASSEDVLDRVNLMEECGDILWYVGIAADALGATDRICQRADFVSGLIDLPDNELVNEIFKTQAALSVRAGNIADLAIKKFVFYGKPFDAELLIKEFSAVHSLVDYLLTMAGLTLEQARERNIAKLKKRYGAKFTEAAALNRDLGSERKVLENL